MVCDVETRGVCMMHDVTTRVVDVMCFLEILHVRSMRFGVEFVASA